MSSPESPERRKDMERCRKVRECIGAAVEILRAADTVTAKKNAFALLRSVGPQSHAFSAPSLARVSADTNAAHTPVSVQQLSERSPEEAEDGYLRTNSILSNSPAHQQDRQQRMPLQPQHARATAHSANNSVDMPSEGGTGGESIDVEGFCAQFSTGLLGEMSLLEELLEETNRIFPSAAHMASGTLQGGILALLCELSKVSARENAEESTSEREGGEEVCFRFRHVCTFMSFGDGGACVCW